MLISNNVIIYRPIFDYIERGKDDAAHTKSVRCSVEIGIVRLCLSQHEVKYEIKKEHRLKWRSAG